MVQFIQFTLYKGGSRPSIYHVQPRGSRGKTSCSWVGRGGIIQLSRSAILGSPPKKNFFLGYLPKSQICLPTHPRVFVRFGRTKGEILVEKGDFWGDLGWFWGVWTLFGNQPPHPPTFGRNLPKKNVFCLFIFWRGPLARKQWRKHSVLIKISHIGTSWRRWH